MFGKRATFGAQSAMEYLMTYGWAILIIAVVLAALFALGVFNGSTLAGTACVASPGYLCQNPILGSNGDLAWTFGQNTGSTIYNINIACAATSTTLGLPSNTGSAAAWYELDTGGTVTSSNGVSTNGISMASGQTVSIAALPCLSNTGASMSGSAYGTAYTGFLWVNYTASSSSNVFYTTKIATLSLKVV